MKDLIHFIGGVLMGIGCVLLIIGHTTDPNAFGPGMISLIAGSIGVFGSDYMEENK